MNKRIRNVFTMFLGTGINMLLGIITVPIITRIINPKEYGVFSITQTYMSILTTLCLLGLDQAYVRFYYSEDSDVFRSKLSKNVLKYPVFLSICMAIIVLIFGKYFLELSSVSFIYIGVCIILTVLDTFTRLCVRLEQNAKLYSVLLITHRIVYAVLIIGFVLILNVYSVDALLLGTLLSLFVIILVAVLNKKEIWFGRSFNSKCTISVKHLLKYSYPFIFSSIAGWIFNAMDKLSLQYFSTYTEIGYYAAAANIVALIAIIQTTFSTLWIPMAVENFEKNPDNKDFYVKSNDYMVVIMFTAGATIVLFKAIFGWFLGGDYRMAQFIFPCLILHPIMFTISEVTVYGINFYKKTQWHIVITVLSCIVNFIGNVTLVPVLGGKGAAISTGLSYIVFFVLRTTISNKYYKVKFHFARIAFLLTLLVLYLLYSSFSNINGILITFYFLIIGFIILLYRKEIFEMLKILLNVAKK